MRRRAVLLDALGTLIAFEDPAPALVRELRERHGLEVAEAQARAAVRAEMTYYRAHHDEAPDAAALAALRLRCADVLRESLPPAACELSSEEALAVLLASLHFAAYPEVPGVLERLRARGLALVVVSNWDVSLHDVLAMTGIASLVDGVVTSAETGISKPRPEIFARGLELAGAAPAEAIHVGDSPAHDVAGAIAAGIEPVLVARADAARPPVPDPVPGPAAPDLAGVATIRTLAELPALAT
jgi:putative hydrolase of the HAD superfamily